MPNSHQRHPVVQERLRTNRQLNIHERTIAMKTSRILASTVAAAAFAVFGSSAFAAPVWETQGRSSQITGGSLPMVHSVRSVSEVAGRDNAISLRGESRSVMAGGNDINAGRA
jgi:hypothetical protein